MTLTPWGLVHYTIQWLKFRLKCWADVCESPSSKFSGKVTSLNYCIWNVHTMKMPLFDMWGISEQKEKLYKYLDLWSANDKNSIIIIFVHLIIIVGIMMVVEIGVVIVILISVMCKIQNKCILPNLGTFH